MKMELIEELTILAENATSVCTEDDAEPENVGKWYATITDDGAIGVCGEDWVCDIAEMSQYADRVDLLELFLANAKFIAAACNFVRDELPLLVTECDELKAKLVALQKG